MVKPNFRAAWVLLGVLSAASAQDPESGGFRLKSETSPYLRSHAADPVNWYPWGEAAFALAEKEGRPVLLSIGYAACHWCHVMQRESFQNAEIATVINRGFVAIKVDREERPDVDRVYIEACQRLTGGAGWPLTAFLTPAKKPIFVGTYFPPDDHDGRRGFKNICIEIEKAWKERRSELETKSEEALEYIRKFSSKAVATELPTAKVIADCVDTLLDTEDKELGGFGTAPKFPRPSASYLLLRQALRTKDPKAEEPVRRLLEALRKGGIRDHLAGAFHRYSTDAKWLVPHFEKMLYDQALLAQLFVEGAQHFQDAALRAVAEETLDFCLRELRTKEGGFIAALDADTGHEEGRTYVWTEAEFDGALGESEAAIAKNVFGILAAGNFERGWNVLHLNSSLEAAAAAAGVEVSVAKEHFQVAKLQLLAARNLRAQPLRDTKVLLGWNALLISALARAAMAFDSERYLKSAVDAAQAIEKHLFTRKHGYRRSFCDGEARFDAELSDHAALLNAYLDLHEATLDPRWRSRATEISELIRSLFWMESGHLRESRAKDLVLETRELFDSAWPSATSLCVVGFARLGHLQGEEAPLDFSRQILKSVAVEFERYPAALPHLLLGFDLLIHPVARVELHGPRDAPKLRALHRAVLNSFQPFTVITHVAGEDEPSAIVCSGKTCLEPALDETALRARIDSILSPK